MGEGRPCARPDSLHHEAVATVVRADQAARNAQRVELLPEAANVDAQLVRLVRPTTPPEADDLAGGQEAVRVAQEYRHQVPLLARERHVRAAELQRAVVAV